MPLSTATASAICLISISGWNAIHRKKKGNTAIFACRFYLAIPLSAGWIAKRTGKRLVRVPLAQLDPIHRIDRDSALRSARERADALRIHRDALLATKLLDSEALQAIIPSVSQIKVVQDGGRWLAFEGNGRLYAMREVFTIDDGMRVEVEEYVFDDPRSIRRRLRRVRKLNRLRALPDSSPDPLP